MYFFLKVLSVRQIYLKQQLFHFGKVSSVSLVYYVSEFEYICPMLMLK